MHTITVVPLGPGSPDLLTLGTLRQLKKARQVVLRTRRHGAAKRLADEGLNFDSLDMLYEQSGDFDQFARTAAQTIIDRAQDAAVTYAVADPASDATVALLRQRAGDSLRILPGVSLHAPLVAAALPGAPFLVSNAMDLHVHNAQQPLCVVELNSKALAGEVKLKLLPKYGEDAPVLFFAPGEAHVRSYISIPLVALDRQPRYNHTAGFVVFPQALLERSAYDAEDLLAIMRRLRAPDGCPWDREQTHQSLAKHLVEEANEAACALMDEDWEEAADELGDVFLQLVFHAVVGEEHATFTWEDMLRAICRKLIRRHPHIFGDVRLSTAKEVLSSWDSIKQQERGGASPGERMLQVHRGMAPLLRAEKVQQLAAGARFDWDRPEQALDKVLEEAAELREALRFGQDAAEELGDLLFSCVNTARLMDISADHAIQISTEKFVRRFNWMEKAIKKDEKDWNQLTINQIGVYWDRSKTEE